MVPTQLPAGPAEFLPFHSYLASYTEPATFHACNSESWNSFPCHSTRKVFPSQDLNLLQTWSYGNTVCSIDLTSFCKITKTGLGMEPFPGNTEGCTPTTKPLAVYLLPNSWNFEAFCHRAWRPLGNCIAQSLQLPDSQCWSCQNMTSRETGVRRKLACQLLFPQTLVHTVWAFFFSL